jgi:hypothetical protein
MIAGNAISAECAADLFEAHPGENKTMEVGGMRATWLESAVGYTVLVQGPGEQLLALTVTKPQA